MQLGLLLLVDGVEQPLKLLHQPSLLARFHGKLHEHKQHDIQRHERPCAIRTDQADLVAPDLLLVVARPQRIQDPALCILHIRLLPFQLLARLLLQLLAGVRLAIEVCEALKVRGRPSVLALQQLIHLSGRARALCNGGAKRRFGLAKTDLRIIKLRLVCADGALQTLHGRVPRELVELLHQLLSMAYPAQHPAA